MAVDVSTGREGGSDGGRGNNGRAARRAGHVFLVVDHSALGSSLMGIIEEVTDAVILISDLDKKNIVSSGYIFMRVIGCSGTESRVHWVIVRGLV